VSAAESSAAAAGTGPSSLRSTALDRLTEIDRRAMSATPGPWVWDGDLAVGRVTLEATSTPDVQPNRTFPTTTVVSASGMHTEGYIDLTPGDAEFIAQSRTDVPVMATALRAVLALHERGGLFGEFCRGCSDSLVTFQWPCATVRVIETELAQ